MTRNSVFSSPFLLGFDAFEEALERVSKASDGYPPYNIEAIGPDRLRISVAVAGFADNELTVAVENNELKIAGRQADGEDRHFIHRGIATRQFQRRFVLADGIEVTDACLDRGLLHVDLMRPQTEETTRTVRIRNGGDS